MNVIAVIITSYFVIPLQVQQALIHDDLSYLRKQLLLRGAVHLIVAIVSIIALTLRFFVTDSDTLRYIITTMIFVHNAGLLYKSYVDYRVYTSRYKEQSFVPEKK